MPAADSSEFSYGYAVVRQAEDLLATLGASPVGAPTLPSLLKEATVGYDAELVAVDYALFLQFKRSFFVSRQHTRGGCGYNRARAHRADTAAEDVFGATCLTPATAPTMRRLAELGPSTLELMHGPSSAGD